MFAEDKFRTPVNQKLKAASKKIADTVAEGGHDIHDVTVSTQSGRFCMTCNSTFTREFTQCPNDATTLVELTNTSLIGSIIGNYKIISLVDEGGMGVIYKAEHLVMQRVVALKMIRSGTADQEILLRFQQEARAVSALTHPNIVSIFGCEVSPEGVPFLVMEYIDGKILGSKEITSQLSLDLAVDVFITLCDALEHAHQQGVVHRDLKPGNIMFSHSGQELRAKQLKILDFGIAKILPESGKGSMDLTQTGQPIGSPMYMSPEQCTASALDARSDIYSLGCVMYFALTGNAPFAGRSIFELFNKHLSEQPASLRKNSAFKVPLELEEIVLKTLEKRPEKRYQSMGELRCALESLKNKRTALIPFLVSILTRKLTTGHISKTIFSFLVPTVCLVLTGVCAYQFLPEPARRAMAQMGPSFSTKQQYARLIATGQKSYRSGHYGEAFKHFSDALGEADKIGHLSSSAYEALLAMQRCNLQLHDPAATKKLSAKLDQFRWQNYRPEADSMPISAATIERLQNQILKTPDHSASAFELSKLLNYQAHSLSRAGENHKAQELAQNALNIESKQPAGKSTARAMAISQEIIGLTLNAEGDPVKSQTVLLESLRSARDALADTSPLLAAIEADLSYSCCEQKKFKEALTWIDRAEKSTSALEGRGSHAFSVCLEHEGRIYAVSGEYKTARNKLAEALVIREHLFGIHAPECRAIYALLQWVAQKEEDAPLSSYWNQEMKAATSQPLR